uniref:Solute carrier family 35 member F2 n=1 Tax=Leptobrachium leishanense TaxID=445787 RepID=A0A8C5QFI7_9ANUR
GPALSRVNLADSGNNMSNEKACSSSLIEVISLTGENGLVYIVRKKWWKYILLAIVDVEANYSIVKASQYTTITSVQLLDCVGIPVLMALSWFILRSRYGLIHYIAVVVCLLGVGTMVVADVLSEREWHSTSMLIDDLLVILGACLYAVSNIEEFLGMLGLFGTFVSGIQLNIQYAQGLQLLYLFFGFLSGLLFAVFALCMFGLATLVNLGILTADLCSLFFGLFLFGYNVSQPLHFLTFVVIMVGFLMYCSMATYLAEPAPEPEMTNQGLENNAMKDEEPGAGTRYQPTVHSCRTFYRNQWRRNVGAGGAARTR